MNLNNIVVVLDRPEESRNIGAVCRAMANNSIKQLRIIAKKENIDQERVRILSIHAFDIYQNALFFDSISDAVKDCAFAAGTTRRKGKKRQGKLLLPEELASFADKITGSPDKKNDGQKIAIVFGNERTGLEDSELNECNMAVTIPSSDEFGSLNLSHAVQIITYHLFRAQNKKQTGYTPITRSRLDQSVKTIADSLQSAGFFKITGRPDMENFWQNILSRAALSEGEAQYLEKTFTKLSGLISKKQKNL